MENRIQHFGVWIKESPKNRINRDNYAIIDKNSSTWSPKIGHFRKLCYKTVEDRKKDYDDVECKVYSDSFCEEWQEKCLINFDKNMEFFKQIAPDDFEKSLQQLICTSKKVRQIYNLNDCKEMCGIYIMVLDEYKQVYIGQARDIKRRIMSHWTSRKPFDRLIFGGINGSVLSIDSFGALDTTRIFVLETGSLDSNERLMVNKMPTHFKLNRVGGGSINGNFDLLSALAEWNIRPLKDCHSDEYAEKYEKEMDVTYFISQGHCDSQELATGDIVCLERTNKGMSSSVKYYGEVTKVNKTRIYMHTYCGPIIGNSCYSSECKKKYRLPEEIRIKKTMRFSKVEMVKKKEVHTFWRSKKFPHLEA